MNSNTISEFYELLSRHIAGIFRDVSYLPDEFFDLLLEYSSKYSGFDNETIELTIENIYIDYIKSLLDEYKFEIQPQIDEIDEYILNYPEDLSMFHSFTIFAMVFEDKQINDITLITQLIQNKIQNNPHKIVNYLINNIDKYK